MRYWLTYQWPPWKGWNYPVGDKSSDDKPYVWLEDGKQDVGAKLARDDFVLFCETRGGGNKGRVIEQLSDGSTKAFARRTGLNGIIRYGRVRERLEPFAGSKPQQYANGSPKWWRWRAPVLILSDCGYVVPRKDVNVVMGRLPGYDFVPHSGLEEVSSAQYHDLVSRFHKRDRSQQVDLPSFQEPSPSEHRRDGDEGREGDTHLFLKTYVAEDPARALGEPGLKSQNVEYRFPTGDRADIVLADAHGRVVGVEIEPAVGNSDIVGPLQAIKYRYMLEWVARRAPGDSRAFLVAHSIDADMKKLCDSYAVECFEIDKGRVDEWRRSKA